MTMFNFIKRDHSTIDNLDKFLDTIDQSLLVFKDGVKNYLYGNRAQFNSNLETMATLEAESNALRREIESGLYSNSSLLRVRGDMMRLLENIDHIIVLLKNSLFQFEIETPYVPAELFAEFIKLTELSVLSVETLIPATKAYFKKQDALTEKLHRVYFYEKEVDKQSQSIKRTVFHSMNTLKLSEKFHLRYFALHIENLAYAAEKAADQLSVMSIKRSI